ncbi:MAG: Mrp/NBP35 family ATP-binding protein [Moraxella sp.]|nr:Mrp/NBP35 family ATP-binding protein [Moraxella sp.]
MFQLFKKAKITIEDVNQVLDKFFLFNAPLTQFIDDKTLNGDTLNLSLKIHKDADQAELEKVYNELRSRLHLLGIQEVNANVLLTDKVQALPNSPATASNTAQLFIPNPTHADDLANTSDNHSHNHSDNHLSNSSQPTHTKTAPKQQELPAHPRIKHIIVIASGKGGVGKSTTTVNVALALQKLGKRVGILDADIYGPSVPDMLGVAHAKPAVEYEQFIPIDADGIAMLSIGNLIDTASTPIAWRGIKATGALMQLYNQANWPSLDYLMIDMPPGTGDIQLSLAQRIPITAAIIVTTPQHIALLDAQKGMEMFHKTGIAVLGVIENMALHTCTNCGHTEAIFGANGGVELAERYQVPLLGQLPLAGQIRKQMDEGVPSVKARDEFAVYYENIAKNIETHIGKFDKSQDNNRIF